MNVEPDAPDYDEMRDAFLQHYEKHICDQTVLFPGMAALVAELERHELPWGIVTNKPHRYTVPLMEKLGYAKRAACLVSGDTCEHAKPHPMPLLHAAMLMGVAPEICLYLGDDLRDMEAAQASGMTRHYRRLRLHRSLRRSRLLAGSQAACQPPLLYCVTSRPERRYHAHTNNRPDGGA